MDSVIRNKHLTEIDISDELLIKRVSALDEEAFNELYGRYSARMLRYFYRMLNQNTTLAQDFVQDLFLKIIEKADSFLPEYKFSTWIYTLAANMCKNEYRKRNVRDLFATQTLHELPIFDQKMEKTLDQKAFQQALDQSLNLLSPEQKHVFILKYQEELSIKEISQICRCAEGTVKSRLFYALKKLADKLAIYYTPE